MLFFRRLRGILGTALVWTVLWLPVSLVMAIYRYLPLNRDFPVSPVKLIAVATLAWSVWGGLSGALFATILAIAERRRTFSQLSARRVAAWGALGAIALPGAILSIAIVANPGFNLIPFSLLALTVSGVLGGTCAIGTLALARRASPGLSGPNPSGGSLTSA